MSDDEIIARIREQHSDLPPPAPPEAVAELEGVVGHPMPFLLKRIYLEVADGGFGRWGEALSLTVPYEFSDSPILVETYLGWIEGGPERGYVHPPSVVPLLTWGCAIWSMVDYSTPEGRMWGWDPNGCCLRHALFPEDRTLAERLTGWLDGNDEELPQPSAQTPPPEITDPSPQRAEPLTTSVPKVTPGPGREGDGNRSRTASLGSVGISAVMGADLAMYVPASDRC